MLHQIKWLWDNMDPKDHVRHVIALVICVFTSALLLVNPAITQRIVDDVLLAQNPEPLFKLLAIMLVCRLGREGLRYYMVITMERDAQNMIFNLRRKLFGKLQYTDMSFFNQRIKIVLVGFNQFSQSLMDFFLMVFH